MGYIIMDNNDIYYQKYLKYKKKYLNLQDEMDGGARGYFEKNMKSILKKNADDKKGELYNNGGMKMSFILDSVLDKKNKDGILDLTFSGAIMSNGICTEDYKYGSGIVKCGDKKFDTGFREPDPTNDYKKKGTLNVDSVRQILEAIRTKNKG